MYGCSAHQQAVNPLSAVRGPCVGQSAGGVGEGGLHVAGALAEAHTEGSVTGAGQGGSKEPPDWMELRHMALMPPRLPFWLQSEHNLVAITASGTARPHPGAHHSENLR